MLFTIYKSLKRSCLIDKYLITFSDLHIYRYSFSESDKKIEEKKCINKYFFKYRYYCGFECDPSQTLSF